MNISLYSYSYSWLKMSDIDELTFSYHSLRSLYVLFFMNLCMLRVVLDEIILC